MKDPASFSNANSLNNIDRKSKVFKVFLVEKNPNYEESQEKLILFEPDKVNNWPYGNNDANDASVDWMIVFTVSFLNQIL